MTEPMIEQTEAQVEKFTDELSDEALDRSEGASLGCVTVHCVCAHWIEANDPA